MVQKPRYRLILTLIIGFAIWLIPFFIFGFGSEWNDNFETYELNTNLTDYEKWNTWPSTYFKISDEVVFSGVQSVKTLYFNGEKLIRFFPNQDISTGIKKFTYQVYVYDWKEADGNVLRFFFTDNVGSTAEIRSVRWSENPNKMWLLFEGYKTDCQTKEPIGYGSWEWGDKETGDYFNKNEWVEFSVEIDLQANFIKMNAEAPDRSWPTICGQFRPDTYEGIVSKIDIKTQNAYYYFDTFSFFSCSNFETWLTCENANCCWAYVPLFYRGVCGDCGYPELCGVGFWSERCQYCATQETCEVVESCYWADNFCRYGTGKCGEGLELQFCENQEDCEEKGGYWYDNYCWLEPKPIFIDWSDYYNDYGDYAEPSAWINNLALSVNQFYEKVGGFLSTFERAFDVRGAHQKGLELGSTIPVARGYLASLNSFAGNLPIGEIFIFILVFMIVVGIFRLIRALVQLVKFW